ncbi:MAG: 16S rRNA (adenine(1518)-N(6)/adenine(1519)-N(6))-dimethyltransferase RsmA [Candidatus ainarchaeum sp.]|nr:16S rRNA (adenine(1518)-N(6)/adenine(1519)-N(6))-dimethyltransferase RsmA [Candidatus ainarchaeum sp.]
MSLLPELNRISRQYGFLQKKKLSQSFLVDERVLRREAGYLSPKGKTVLEIGPGFGFLTRELALAGAKRIVAVEKDSRLMPVLEAELSGFGNVELVNADFLETGVEADLVASNVPYSVSSPILFKLAETRFERAVLCLQREFVSRMLARPGEKEYSRLSLASQAALGIEFLERVPRSAFHPPPKVDSAIIRVSPTGGTLSGGERMLALNLFQHRKKTVRAAMSDSAEALGISKAAARLAAEKSGFAKARVFSLSRENVSRIASLLGS